MSETAANEIQKRSRELVKSIALRCVIVCAMVCLAVLAVTAAGPSWAGRVWSDTATVRTSVAHHLFYAKTHPQRISTVPEDDYVAGLRKLGIVPPR
jgi:hypothetical protein